MFSVEELLPHDGQLVPIPLVPEDGLYLWDWGIDIRESPRLFQTPSRITRKFVKCFRSTWMMLPEKDRETLKRFWGTDRPLLPDVKPSPGIEFNSFCLPVTMSAACRGGRELLFSIEFLDYAKPPAIINTIAHELGHSISYPHGWYEQHECKARSGECIACECRAYSYMAAWGFDPFLEMLPKQRKGRNLIDRFRQKVRT